MTQFHRATSSTGRCGELLTMFHLEMSGVQAVLVDRAENDLWVQTPTGRMLAVQVKTAQEPRQHKGDSRPLLHFGTDHLAASTDVFALVALHARVVVFCAPQDMKRRMDPEEFTSERMDASIKELFT